VKDGRFGAYVTDGETNATLRRGDTLDALTLERGLELLAGRRAWELENGASNRKEKRKSGRKSPTLTKTVIRSKRTKTSQNKAQLRGRNGKVDSNA